MKGDDSTKVKANIRVVSRRQPSIQCEHVCDVHDYMKHPRTFGSVSSYGFLCFVGLALVYIFSIRSDVLLAI